MSEDLAFEDLDLSVRGMRMVMDLGIATLGELAALPRVEGSPIVLAELRQLLSDNGLEPNGEWVSSVPPPAVVATGSVIDRWKTIAAWLEENAPGALATFQPPASAAAIAAAESALGLTLPADYKDFLGLHDGQHDGPMVNFCSLLSVDKLVSEREGLIALFHDGEAPSEPSAIDRGISPRGDWDAAWVPIGRFQRDVMVLDLAPAEGGKSGQIFVAFVDDDARKLLATSFTELLARYFAELQDETIDLSLYDDGDDA